jgi:hypothetical protein
VSTTLCRSGRAVLALAGCVLAFGCKGKTTSGGPPDGNGPPLSPHAPIADAGADQTVAAHSLVGLDGTASTDPDGDAITFLWRQMSGDSVTLSSPTDATPTFLAPANGKLAFSLVVSDGEFSSAAATVTLTVVPRSGARPSPDVVFVAPQGSISASAPLDLAMVGDAAYVADSTDGLLAYDVSDVTAPVLRGSAGPGIERVCADSNLAVGALGDSFADGVLTLFDVSAATPVELARLTGGPGGFVVDDGARVYAARAITVWLIDPQQSPPVVVGGLRTDVPYIRGLAADGGRLYVTGDSAGLQIYDVTDPAAPALLGAYTAAGLPSAVWASSNVAYVRWASDELRAIGVADPAHPVLLGSITLTTPADMAFAGSHAFVADGASGVRVLDVSGAAPAVVATFDTPGSAVGVAVVGTTLAVADSTAALFLDIGTPTSPTLVATLATLHPRTARRIGSLVLLDDTDLVDVSVPSAPVVVGGTPYLGPFPSACVVGSTLFGLNYLPAVEVLDLAVPSAPAAVTTVLLPGPYYVADIVGTHLFAVFKDSLDYWLDVIDVSTPAVPRVLARMPSGWPYGVTAGNAAQVFVAGNSWAQVYDVTDPLAPVAGLAGSGGWPAAAHNLLLASIGSFQSLRVDDYSTNPASSVAPGIWGYFADVAWSSSILVAAETTATMGSYNRIATVDLALPGTPAFVGNTPLGAEPLAVAAVGNRIGAVLEGNTVWFAAPAMAPFVNQLGKVSVSVTAGTGPILARAGDHALAITDNDNVTLVDVSAATAPSVIATYHVGAFLRGIRGAGTRLYLLTSTDGASPVGRVDIVDIADLAHPTKLGEYSAAGVLDVAASGDVLYVAKGAQGLSVVDIADPAAPQQVGSSSSVLLQSIMLSGTRLYGTSGSVIDVSDPHNPVVLLANTYLWGDPFAVIGDLLVTALNDQVRVLDMSTPSNPTGLGTTTLPWGTWAGSRAGEPSRVQLEGNWAWVPVADPGAPVGSVRFVAVDLSLPTHPMLAASFHGSGTLGAFAAREGVIWSMTVDNTMSPRPQLTAAPTLRGAVRLREDVAVAQVAARLTYHIDFTDRDPNRAFRVRCAVTGGSCSVGAVDVPGHTAQVLWDLPGAPGEAELAVVVGNERWSAVATDWLNVE